MGNQRSQQYEDEVCFNQKLVQVKQDEKNLPLYKVIGLLFCSESNNLYQGTAFCISPTVIVTAAHNIYDKNQEKQRSEIKICPQAFGEMKKWIKVKKAKICEEYLKNKNQIGYDFAICLLEQPAAFQEECLSIGYNFDIKNQQKVDELHIFGYPNQKCAPVSKRVSDQSYQASLCGRMAAKQDFPKYIFQTNLQRGAIYHKIPTSKGQSGSPIIAKVQDQYVIVGISKGSRCLDEQLYNVGVLFTIFFVERLNQFFIENKVRDVHIFNLRALQQKTAQISISKTFVSAHQTYKNLISSLRRGFQWNKNSISKPEQFHPFLIEEGFIARTSHFKEQMQEIRSANLNKLFSSEGVLRLQLSNFHFESHNTRIEFGLLITQEQQIKEKITYIIYNLTNRKGEGRLSKGKQVKFQQIQELFVSQNQFLNMTVDLPKKKVTFIKANKDKQFKQYEIDLEKHCRSEIEVFLYTRLKDSGCSFEVKAKFIKQK